MGRRRGAAICCSLYDDTNTILRLHSPDEDERVVSALVSFLVLYLGGKSYYTGATGQTFTTSLRAMRRFGTESTRRSSSREATGPRVDEAAMQAKLKELRGLMASEHAARETIRDVAET